MLAVESVIDMTTSLLQRLFGGPFRSYEKAILESVANCLSGTARDLFLVQMRSVNKVQRHAKDKEVNLYCMKGGKAFLDESVRFKNRSGDLLLATALLRIEEGIKPIRVEVWISNGRLFSMTFDQSPSALVRQSSAAVTDTKLHADPCTVGMTPPEVPDARSLPPEYQGILNQTPSRLINGWRLNTPEELRKVIQPERNYLVLAEKDGVGVIAVPDSEQNAASYFLSYEDDVPIKIETSLLAFMEAAQPI